MDAGALPDVMSMALAKTIEAHGTKKRKHPTETTADKLKAIAYKVEFEQKESMATMLVDPEKAERQQAQRAANFARVKVVQP